MVRDTVAIETPASFATSLMETMIHSSDYPAGVRSAMAVANAISYRVHRIRTSLTTRLCLLLICVSGAGELHGADFSLGEFTLRIPNSFEGPQTSSSMAGMVNHVFSVPTDAPPAPALMFIIREGEMAMPDRKSVV